MYFVKTPRLLKPLYKDFIWNIEDAENSVFLTFDDGPTPGVTDWVLNQLKKYRARATFFCIGKNVQKHPLLYQRILEEGHLVGNHTWSHPNGWKTADDIYLHDVMKCSGLLGTTGFFRPPYGKASRGQVKKLKTKFKIIMWDVLSGDFDPKVSPGQCLQNVTKNSVPGSIIVFHDSEKAKDKLFYTLPRVLDFFSEQGYHMLPLPE